MNKKLFTIFVLSLLILSCRKDHLSFPNGYILSVDRENHTYLKDNNKNNVIESPISQFCFRQNCIYGWVDDKDETFFFLDTNTKKLIKFNSWKEINQFLTKKGWPGLKMNDSFTYLDIKTGHKKKTW